MGRFRCIEMEINVGGITILRKYINKVMWNIVGHVRRMINS